MRVPPLPLSPLPLGSALGAILLAATLLATPQRGAAQEAEAPGEPTSEPAAEGAGDVAFDVAAPVPETSLLVTVNVDGARVQIDDLDLGESPVARARLIPGRHVVVVMREGYATTRRTVELDSGASERLDVVLAPATLDGDTALRGVDRSRETPLTEEPLFWVAIGGGALVVIGVAIGIGFAVSGDGSSGQPSGIRLPPIH